MIIDSQSIVDEKFASYPDHIRPKMEYLRQLIFETAEAIPEMTKIEETLKWGEPAYLTKKGSTVRIDWKTKNPEVVSVYFKCTSLLVATFREIYGPTFNYEKNRAIFFELEQEIPEKELKHCISLALRYHELKKLPLLGAE